MMEEMAPAQMNSWRRSTYNCVCSPSLSVLPNQCCPNQSIRFCDTHIFRYLEEVAGPVQMLDSQSVRQYMVRYRGIFELVYTSKTRRSILKSQEGQRESVWKDVKVISYLLNDEHVLNIGCPETILNEISKILAILWVRIRKGVQNEGIDLNWSLWCLWQQYYFRWPANHTRLQSYFSTDKWGSRSRNVC